MLKKTGDGYELARSGEFGIFLDIVCEQYKVYSDFIHKLPNINELEPEEIVRLNHHQIDPLYICTVFSAMFLEAFIFDYGARKASGAFIKNYIDKLDPPAKWLIVTRLFNSEGIDSSSKCFELIDMLFKKRNKLVHSKTKEFTEFESLLKKNPTILKPVECLDLVILVMNEILRIDPNEKYAEIVRDNLVKLKKKYPA
ncbi:MAG TPA: hypothetical protein VMX17_01195 [Candidatus Glassbacteria bacterium]|nr:hypothetical protein [Candidatus Glassbacteria bacterium]